VRTWRTDWGRLTLPLLGPHQAHNAAVALAGLDLLAEVEPSLAVTRNDVVKGFAELRWPARVEVLGEEPWLVIDGAHNAASAAALAETLRTCFPPARRTLIFGTSREKDLEGQLRELLPAFDTVIATRYIENPRSVSPEAIAACVIELTGSPVRIAADPPDALELSRRLTPPDGLICVTGSLFLAAEARAVVLPHVRAPYYSGAVT
jgi:dihydrofolate synthase/folylpolyglutamate synthase